MPQVSAELRWFFQTTDAAHAEVFQHWFMARPIAPGGGIRSDTYVVDESTDELGIKSRGDKPGLEVKTLADARLHEVTFGGRTASVQMWTKTTWNVTLPATTLTRTIKKSRLLRKFDTSGAGAIELELGAGLSGEERRGGKRPPDIGCNVEWTKVETGDSAQNAWTFGVEAFALHYSFGSLGAILKDAVDKTLTELASISTFPEPFDDRWKEWSYPAWIRTIDQ